MSKRRSERRRLDSIVSVRFTPAEVDELRRRAKRMGMSTSGYLRSLAIAPQTYGATYGCEPTVTIAGPVVVHFPEETAS